MIRKFVLDLDTLLRLETTVTHGDCAQKSKLNLSLFTPPPVKMREVLAKCLSFSGTDSLICADVPLRNYLLTDEIFESIFWALDPTSDTFDRRRSVVWNITQIRGSIKIPERIAAKYKTFQLS